MRVNKRICQCVRYPALLLLVGLLLGQLSACASSGPSQNAAGGANEGSAAGNSADPLPRAGAAFDLDGDRIPDAIDLCPGTPGPQPVDFEGCPIFAGAIRDVDFPPDSSVLSNRARRSLDKLVLRLQQHPEVVVAVDGHTDNRGSGQVNLDLSKERVMAVVRYLVARGVSPQRLRPYAYGESRPIISNATPEGRSLNRRIEVSVVLMPDGDQTQVEPVKPTEAQTGAEAADAT